MKALGALVILALVGYAGFQYAYQPIVVDLLGFAKPAPPAPPVEKAPVIVSVEPPPMAPKVEEPKPEMPKLPEPVPTPPPAMPAIPANLGASVPVADADGFTPPTFPPIEDVVKNWMEIPKTAFPRPVKVKKPLEFATIVNGRQIGSSKVPAGGEAQVISQDGLTLTLAPSPTSSAHTQVTMDETDLKAVLNDAYERWKVAMTEYKRRQHLFAKESEGRASEAKASGKTAAASNDAPKKNAEGSYDLLLASMKAGQVTEITPSNVKKWGDVQIEKIDGKDYFTVIVDYTTKTMFGDFDTQAQARIAANKVEKWIYTGSGEVVP